MDTTHPISDPILGNPARPHPLLLAAAASVTVLSLAGVGVLAGWLPGPGQGATHEPPKVAQASPAPISIQQTVNLPQEKAAAKSNGTTTTAPARRAASATTGTARPSGTTPAVAVSSAPTYPVSTAAICRDCGVVEAVRETRVEPKGSGGGAVAGGIVGGLLGNQIGKGATRDIATVLGAVGGAYAGNHIEKSMKDGKRYDVVVRFEDGSTRTFSSETRPAWYEGDRVRLQNGALVSREGGGAV